MPVSAYDAVRHYQQRQSEAMQAIASFERLQQQTQAAGTRARQQLQAACLELAQAYLPGLTPAHIHAVEQLTGYVAFKQRNPIKAMEREHQTLKNSIARIESDPRYQQREVLAGPDGTIGAKLAEAREMIAPFAAECAKFEQQLSFDALLQVGYDTPDFKEKWWSGDYWEHWSAGDRICKALGMDDFGDDVLPAYQKVATQRDFWQREIDQYNAQLTEIHELVRSHDSALARIPQLAHLYLEQSQQVLARHLDNADVQLLDEWRIKSAPNDRGIQIGLRKMAGLRAKFDMLSELHNKGIKSIVDSLRVRANKYARKSAKYSRPTHYRRIINDNDLDHKFGAKFRKLQQRQQKLSALVTRIDRYNDYQSFQLNNDQELWWWELSGGKRPPREIPRLRRYFDRHPNAIPQRDQAAAATAVSRAASNVTESDDYGYLS